MRKAPLEDLMTAYVLRRILLIFPTLIIVSFLVFVMVRLLPGDAVDLMVEQNGYAANRDELESQLGLDKPLPKQYLVWVGELIRGDLGTSLWTKRSAVTELKQIVPVSLELTLLSTVFAVGIGVPIGILAAIRQDSAPDLVLRALSIGALSIPGFWLATLLLVFPAIWWNWSPPLTYTNIWENPAQNLKQVFWPAFILSIYSAAVIMRMTRSMMLEVVRQDYVRTARSKGLGARTVIIRHALRNALLPIVTIVGLQIPAILSGAVIMESIFGLPGIGRFVIQVISQRDYPMLQIITLLLALVVLCSNVIVDVTYALLDPRVQVS